METTEPRNPGRPLDDPWYRAHENFRALVSPATRKVLEKAMEKHDLTQSNLTRLALWKLLEADGLTKLIEVEKDNTWRDLREAGLI
jgi:hypothetical protein